jgi:hypothetical protein
MTQLFFHGLQGGSRLRSILLSAFMFAALVVVIVWSVLANAADIVIGLIDSTGATPRRR